MSGFNDIRTQLNSNRSEKQAAEQTLFKRKQALAKAERELDELTREFDLSNANHVQRKASLEGQISQLNDDVALDITALQTAVEAEALKFLEFEPFIDPRQAISQMSDDYPFLLFPVRIETRFKKVEVPGAPAPIDQLWLRIYPDACAMDTFEPLLSESEVANAGIYWSNIWQAGGIEDQERGAWRTLVSSYGSGRSAWIKQEYVPENAADQPTKADKNDVILVIRTEEMPPAPEPAAITDFWKALWLADGDLATETAAVDALKLTVGEARAKEIMEQMIPDNFANELAIGVNKPDVNLDCVFLHLPDSQALETKFQSWSQAPRVKVMPDSFVITGYRGDNIVLNEVLSPIATPLIVGPNPSAEVDDQIKEENGEVIPPEEMRWMVDFEDAITKGMAAKFNLNDDQAENGFDRLVVLGVRLSADEDKGQELLEELLEHHHYSYDGLSILPQGTPTNNTEKEGAGHRYFDDPDESFDDLKQGDLFAEENDWFAKKDGQWFAELLGVDSDKMKKIRNSGHTDQCEARAMNVALWPTTMGYMMDSLLPIFGEQTMDQTRSWFNHFVNGRGMIPALKIGDQPYGILPTTAFSKFEYFSDREQFSRLSIDGISYDPNFFFMQKLYHVLSKIDSDWAVHLDDVAHVGKEGDAHQILLDLLGLSSGSVEFHQRIAESMADLLNRFKVWGPVTQEVVDYVIDTYKKSGEDLLKTFGFNWKGKLDIDILTKFFMEKQNLLKGPLIDDRPLSEKDLIRGYTPDAVSKNYIEWLIDASRDSHNTLRMQNGFIDNQTPNALLYLMLHHSLDVSYIETSLNLHRANDLISSQEFRKAKVDPEFIHIQGSVVGHEGKYQHLYKAESTITGANDLLIGDYIPQILDIDISSAYLKKQLSALEHLKDAPTARLERAFVEHLDLCTYRLDGWKSGFINYKLASMRYGVDDDHGAAGNTKKGVYLGAYGYLEDVRPENKILEPVELQGDLLETFNPNGDKPVSTDSTNGGHISAPSINQAVTASILRNGYMANADEDNPDALSINLSSERVRKAQSLIEGIRGGQSLSALLGFHFERGLHDAHPGLELDFYIYHIRKAFPLTTNTIQLEDSENVEDDTAMEAIEARNVVDGVKLINHIKATGSNTYPFGKSLPAVTSPDHATAINAEVDKIMNLNDALADVAISESVHQVVQGNYDRGVASLDAYSKGNFPPIPDVTSTPRSGKTLTHKVGLQLATGLDHTVAPNGNAVTPRSMAEPAINSWLTTTLPAVGDISCRVNFHHHGTAADREEFITAEMLGFQPIDLLYLVDTDSEQAMTFLDDRVVKYVHDTFSPRPDAEIAINYADRIAGKINFFELAAMMNSLRSIVLRSRPLEPNDVGRPNDVKRDNNSQLFIDQQRLVDVRDLLSPIATAVADYEAALALLLANVDDPAFQFMGNIDTLCDDLISLFTQAGNFGLPQTGFGFAIDRKRELYKAALDQVNELIARWDAQLADFDAKLVAYDALPAATADEDRLKMLKAAERLTSTAHLQEAVADFRLALNQNRMLFETKLNTFKAIRDANEMSLSALLSNISIELPISDFDLVPLSISDQEDQVIVFAKELAEKALGLSNALTTTLAKVVELLAEATAATVPTKAVQVLQDVGRRLLGEDFKIVPEFTIPEKQADEWANSYGDQAQLLNHLTTVAQIDFPLDDWLYGVARVREKVHHWENVTLLAEAFDSTAPQLQAIQLPYAAGDSWLGLEYPSDYDIESDRVLYTAHYAAAFVKTERQCGLLIDEWTEVIPSKEETMGVAFHYDRPNSEPGQSMLLAVPFRDNGEWQWSDLLDIVNETFVMAKKRAIEPEQIDKTAYARFLPATVSSMTVHPLTATLNYAFNNQIFELLNNDSDE